MYIYTHIYTYVYICMYTHMYIYMCIFPTGLRSQGPAPDTVEAPTAAPVRSSRVFYVWSLLGWLRLGWLKIYEIILK